MATGVIALVVSDDALMSSASQRGQCCGGSRELHPDALFLEAIAVSTVPSQGFVGVVSEQLGLAAWAVAATALAGVAFGRRDA